MESVKIMIFENVWLELTGSPLFDKHHMAYILMGDLLAALNKVTVNCKQVSSEINH
jgi:hypothetical protein